MPGIIESCKQYFASDTLYGVLDVPKTASAEEIKKAYRRLSLKIHPDRVVDSEKEEATEKFKILSKVHCILSDKEKRACYDETGCIDDGDESDFEQRDWYSYWRNLFKQITEEDIVNYHKKYTNSEEEKTDLIDAYKSSKGDIDMILEKVPFAHPRDIDRYRDILQPLIDSNELPKYKKFLDDSPRKQEQRKRKYEKEEKEALKMDKKKGKGREKAGEELAENDLLAAITARRQQRCNDFENMCANLEAKYGNSKKGRSNGRRK